MGLNRLQTAVVTVRAIRSKQKALWPSQSYEDSCKLSSLQEGQRIAWDFTFKQRPPSQESP